MRVLILILILLVPLSSNTFAMSAGDLYKYCKPYADRAFKSESIDDLTCVTYFRGVADTGKNICTNMKAAIPAVGEDSDFAAGLRSVQKIEGLGSVNHNDMDAAIQSFVNEMSTKPENWRFLPVQYVHAALQKLVPCK